MLLCKINQQKEQLNMPSIITKYDIFCAKHHYKRAMRSDIFDKLKPYQKKSVINLKNKWDNYKDE